MPRSPMYRSSSGALASALYVHGSKQQRPFVFVRSAGWNVRVSPHVCVFRMLLRVELCLASIPALVVIAAPRLVLHHKNVCILVFKCFQPFNQFSYFHLFLHV